MIMVATLALLLLLGVVLLGISYATDGPGRRGLVGRLGHGLREFDRLSRLHSDSLEAGRRPIAR